MKKLDKQTILITGGAGYIGSFISLYFKKKYKIIVIDDLSLGKKTQIRAHKFYKFNLNNAKKLNDCFKKNYIDIIFHLAAYSNLRSSKRNKKIFYLNNFNATKNIVNAAIKYKVNKFIFSSTASVYGNNNKNLAFREGSMCKPISIYGKTKLDSENYIKKKANKFFRCIIFRFFNVAGADFKKRLGETKNPPEHFIPLIIQAMLNYRHIKIFNKFNTEDGTGLRDYIHVNDIVDAFDKVLKYFKIMKKNFEIFNLGCNKAISTLSIAKYLSKTYNKKIIINYEKKKEGEPDILFSSIKKAQKILDWRPRNNIKKILKDSFLWEKKNVDKF
jgi:UDP-glucose 4-epimerase